MVLGSAASIALVLVMVLVIFAITAGGQPAIGREYPPLVAAAGLFGLLALAAAFAFVGLQRARAWRWLAQVTMWLALVLIALYYWPDSAA